MKNFQITCYFLILFCVAGFAQDSSTEMQHEESSTHTMVNKSDIKWMDGPPGLPSGAKAAVMSGDPSKEGPFTIRAMLPANFKVPPHWHPTTENVAVLEGTLYMGSGEKFDEKSAKALAVGGFSSIPPKSPHYVFTKEKCVIQVNAMGPFEITYINEADDPRKSNSR